MWCPPQAFTIDIMIYLILKMRKLSHGLIKKLAPGHSGRLSRGAEIHIQGCMTPEPRLPFVKSRSGIACSARLAIKFAVKYSHGAVTWTFCLQLLFACVIVTRFSICLYLISWKFTHLCPRHYVTHSGGSVDVWQSHSNCQWGDPVFKAACFCVRILFLLLENP